MLVGYALITEEHGATTLVENARRAEAAGFDYLSVSDHYHPWLEVQGESPFAWTVLGALAVQTELPLMTAVTCPTRRYHPAIVAQAAATVASMAPSRFRLGLGSGEALNEHITGEAWPAAQVRLEMLEEAAGVIQELFTGREVTHHGRHVTMDRAQLFSLPAEPPPVVIAAAGPHAARLAGRLDADLLCVSPDSSLTEEYREAGGGGTCWSQATVCHGSDEDKARAVVHERWRQSGLDGWDAMSELPTPSSFAQAAANTSEDAAVGHTPCGPRVDDFVESITTYADAGFEAVALHQVGTEQAEFLDFAERELLPALR